MNLCDIPRIRSSSLKKLSGLKIKSFVNLHFSKNGRVYAQNTTSITTTETETNRKQITSKNKSTSVMKKEILRQKPEQVASA